jgi:hypothetical protein
MKIEIMGSINEIKNHQRAEYPRCLASSAMAIDMPQKTG